MTQPVDDPGGLGDAVGRGVGAFVRDGAGVGVALDDEVGHGVRLDDGWVDWLVIGSPVLGLAVDEGSCATPDGETAPLLVLCEFDGDAMTTGADVRGSAALPMVSATTPSIMTIVAVHPSARHRPVCDAPGRLAIGGVGEATAVSSGTRRKSAATLTRR